MNRDAKLSLGEVTFLLWKNIIDLLDQKTAQVIILLFINTSVKKDGC